MKTLKTFSPFYRVVRARIIALFLAVGILSSPEDSFAQNKKTETLKVSGECGMCRKKIEKAAREAGASYARWNIDTKILTVKYSSSSTNSAKIQQKIAGVGYDTPDFKTTGEVYSKLDVCCQYEREIGKADRQGCSDKCEIQDDKMATNCAGNKSCCKKSRQ